MIYIVGAQDGPGEFLGHVAVFVGGAGRGEQSQCIRSMRHTDIFQALMYQVQGFLPSGRAKISVFPDQRRLQAAAGIDKAEPEPAFDAQTAVVGRALDVSLHPVQYAVSVMQVHLAPHTAIAAGGFNLVRLPDPGTLPGIYRNYGAHRTGLHALSAEHAVGFLEGPVSGCCYLALYSPVGMADGVVDLNVAAGLHTAPAKNTFAEVSEYKGVDRFSAVQDSPRGKSLGIYLIAVSQVLQNALTGRGTEQAVVLTHGQEQLQVKPPGVDHPGGFGVDLHIPLGRGNTGCSQVARPLDLYYAQSTGTGGRCPGQVAHGGNKYIVHPGSIQYGHALLKRQVLTVYLKSVPG